MRMKTILCATMLAVPATMAQAQDAQDAISDSVADRLSPGNGTFPNTENGLTESVGEAVRSGAGTATNEVLRGNSVGGAIQQGANQAFRQGTADAARTIAPNQVTPNTYPNGQVYPQGRVYSRGQAYSNSQPAIGQTWYRDSSGRLFRQDSLGNRYYTQSSPSMNATASSNSRPRLGIGIEENDQGVQIMQVTEGSAAAKAGFQSGDVVVSANGQEIKSTDQLAQLVRNADPNADLNMKVMRDGEEQTLTATLASRQGDRYSAAKPVMDGSQGMSARLQALEQEVEQLKSTIETMRDDESESQSKDRETQKTDARQSSDAAGQEQAAAESDASARNESSKQKNASAQTSESADAEGSSTPAKGQAGTAGREGSAKASGSLNADVSGDSSENN